MIWQMLLWLAVPDDYVIRRDSQGMFHVKHIDDLTENDRVIELRSPAPAHSGPAQGLLAHDDGAAERRDASRQQQSDENKITH
jgi:hypothetical protein